MITVIFPSQGPLLVGQDSEPGVAFEPPKQKDIVPLHETQPARNNHHHQFPKWNSTNGIFFQAIDYYFKLAAKHLNRGQDVMCRDHCVEDMPNVIYIFGARQNFVYTSNSTGNDPTRPPAVGSNEVDHLHIFVEGRRRKRVGKGFAPRYPIVEALMLDAMDKLQTDPQYRHSRLYQLLTKETTSGIPMIVNLGDWRNCNYQNLKWNGQWHDVPVFSLATPSSCQHALPIAHPALIDTARAYGDTWQQVQQHRHRLYPWTTKRQQAVWRGSPTGGMEEEFEASQRFQLVQKANFDPQYNHLFDVGFGKTIHKFNISRKLKMWFEDFQHYQVVLDVDGSSWSERFVPLLCLNSLVIKVRPKFVDYLTLQVSPKVHYLETTIDDLYNVTFWALNPENKVNVQRIIANANDWCAKRMTYDRLLQDFLETLESYVSWLDKKKDGNGNDWVKEWERLITTQLPPKHHHWRALPISKSKPYFPINENYTTMAN